MDDQNRSLDRELGAFLGREASRRIVGKRSDYEVVAAVVAGHAAPLRLPGALVAAGTAALGLALVIAVLASGLVSGPAASPSVSPSTGYQAPFGLPTVLSGSHCPVTDRWLVGVDGLPTGAAVGGRPVYAFLADSGSPAYFEAVGIGGWQRVDVLWVAAPGFVGQVTMSGARVDGPGDVSFGDISERVPLPRVELDATLAAHGRPIGTSGWTVLYQFPMLVKAAGCYGLRIDTDQGSSVSVFDVRPVEEAYQELERRPVRLPSIANGEDCPVTPISGEIKFRGWLGSVRGEGPVYVAGPGGTPVIWVADSRELGPLVIRGGRIDAPGELRFNVGAESSPVLELSIHSYVESEAAQQPPGWRQWLSDLSPSSAGCYAVQVDTLPGSQTLVFAVGG